MQNLDSCMSMSDEIEGHICHDGQCLSAGVGYPKRECLDVVIVFLLYIKSSLFVSVSATHS